MTAQSAAYYRAWRAANRARGLPPGDPRHGTVNGHDNYGCDCPPCRAARALAMSVQRRRT